MAGEPISEPPKPPYFKPQRFVDGRLKINPWRETPVGPSYPYEVAFDEEQGVYRVKRRANAPSVSTMPNEPETPPSHYTRPFLYEDERVRR